jgi:hypothetical protein
LGEPTNPLINPEKPDFFLRTPMGFGSLLLSSEYRFGAIDEAGVMSILVANDFSFTSVSAAESAKLAERRSGGGPMMLPVLASGVVYKGMGGGGRWKLCELPGDMGDLVASMRLRIAVPSNGAPISSSEVLVLKGREFVAESELRSL